MTMAELRQMRSDYIALKKEIEDCTEKIDALGNDLIVQDVVTGSSTDDPYTKHPVTIKGIGRDAATKRITRKRQKLIQKRAAAIKEKEKIEQFIDGITDRFMKWAIDKRVIDGLEWQQIANRCGNIITGEALAVRVKRYIKNF